jgi:DNA-binding transcriptional ArsR family regulator
VLVEIEKTHKQKDIQHELENLRRRHGTRDDLHKKVLNDKCGGPSSVDDYVLWKAVTAQDCEYVEKIVVDSPRIFGGLTPRRVELLEYVGRHNVRSIKDLAEELDRNYKNVYDDLKALEEWGLVSLPRRGKDKKPISHVESFHVTFHR